MGNVCNWWCSVVVVVMMIMVDNYGNVMVVTGDKYGYNDGEGWSF